MKNILVFIFAFLWLIPLQSQDKPAYLIYDQSGKQVKYSKVLKAVEEADVLLFGEIHNNPICHWLQLEISKEMIEKKPGKVILGAEMFERDNQLLIDEYFSGAINQKYFEDECRLWKNYPTDYKPLLELAKDSNIPMIATNIPRRYANAVFKNGIESLNDLSEEAKTYIAPLPIEVDLELKSYKSMLEMMGGHADGNTNFPKAQAIKDATMAWFMVQNLKPDHLMIHFHGAFHSNEYEGINWYLDKYRPGLKKVNLTTVLQSDISRLDEENQGLADFIICVPENMCTTHF